MCLPFFAHVPLKVDLVIIRIIKSALTERYIGTYIRTRIFVSGRLNDGGSSGVLGGRNHFLYPRNCTILPTTYLSITDQLRAIIRFR